MNTLEHSPAQIIRQLLIDLSLATDGGASWPAFYSREPGAPDNCITVYATQGIVHGRSMIDGRIVEKRGIQIRIRSQVENVGWVKADAIRTELAESVYQRTVHITSGATHTDYLVHSLDRIGEILSIGTESPTSSRNLFTLNAVTHIRQLP